MQSERQGKPGRMVARRNLKSFQVPEAVYDLSAQFCNKQIDRFSRTREQMAQAVAFAQEGDFTKRLCKARTRAQGETRSVAVYRVCALCSENRLC